MDVTERPAWLRWLARGREDDPRVAHDLDLLAAAYGPGGPAAPDRAATVAHDMGVLAAEYGSGATAAPAGRPGRADVVAHVRRYRVPYGVAAAVLAVLVLADPVPGPSPGLAGTFGSSSPPTTEARPGENQPARLPALEGPPLGFPGETAIGEVPSEPPPIVALPPPPSSSSDDDVPLSIIASGYASVFGGTPIEQPPPEDGLPVAATAGSTTKLSFVRLAGTATVLGLTLVDATGANLNDADAAVKACRITEPWGPQRGTALADAPTYDADDCVVGNVADGVWTFDLAGHPDRAGANGFALVPGVAATGTFQVTFAPTAA